MINKKPTKAIQGAIQKPPQPEIGSEVWFMGSFIPLRYRYHLCFNEVSLQ